jgi:HK97 gp10 family phage protein
MKMKMDLGGLNDLLSNLSEIEQSKKDEVSQIVKETAFKIQAGAKQFSPVDTGNLKRNIKVEISADEMSAKVGTKSEDVEYAHYVEFGTSKAPAQPFLHPAAEEEYPEYIKRLKEVLGEKA